jgi:DNA-binding transcriptional MerR regulator
MADVHHLQQPPFTAPSNSGVGRNTTAKPPSSLPTFSVEEVTGLLQVTPERLQQWGRVFPFFLDEEAKSARPQYSQADLATLLVIQKLLEAGHDHEQIIRRLSIQRATSAATPEHLSTMAESAHTGEAGVSYPDADESVTQVRLARPTEQPPSTPQRTPQLPASTKPANLNETVGELLNTVAGSQQSMLNIQDSIREMLGVIVQDNFNLKHENRKLRERMLELERTLAEYQRREETRKERMEGRLRAVEGTLSAIQQQVAQLVQLQRQRNRRGWFR